MAQERDQPPAVPHQERLHASLMQEIPIGRQVPGQGLLLDGPTPDPAIRKAARLLAVRETRAAAPVPLAREQDPRPTARLTAHTLAAQRQEHRAQGRQRDHPHGKQDHGLTPGATREAASLLAAREMRAAAPVPIAREHDLRLIARQQVHIAAQRQEREAAGLQPAPGPTPGPAIREAARQLAQEGMMAAAPVPQAPVPVPTAREQDQRPVARQQELILAAQHREREAAGRQQEPSQGRQAHGQGPTRAHGPARVEPAAEYRGPVRTGAPTPAAAKAGQRAAGVVRGEGNTAPFAGIIIASG
jgi:dienelactone hydrolase